MEFLSSVIRRFVLRLLLAVVPLVPLTPDVSFQSQGEYEWSKPERIPDYHDMLHAPVLVADPNGTVHAFNYEVNEQQYGVLIYRQWSPAGGWSSPIDILILGRASGPQELEGVFLDDSGILHLIYYTGSLTSGEIHYSKADSAAAGRVSAWSPAARIGTNAGPVASAAITGDGQNRLLVVFGGQQFGTGYYAIQSSDAGNTWSEAVRITGISEVDQWPTSVWLETDNQGRVHAVWHVANSAGQGEEIGYARLSSDWLRWEAETSLARRDTDQENMGWPSLITAGDEVIVIYQDSFPATRWIRHSMDGGNTWSGPIRPFPHVGGYEYAILLKDSANNIHLILGNRVPTPEVHGMWYSQRVEGRWMPLEPIASGPATSTFDPCCPRAVVSQGNVLLATWPHNVRREHLTGAWYSYKYLDAPTLSGPPLPATLAAPSPIVEPTPLRPAATATLGIDAAVDSRNLPPTGSQRDQSPMAPIAWGVVSVCVLLAIWGVWRVRVTGSG